MAKALGKLLQMRSKKYLEKLKRKPKRITMALPQGPGEGIKCYIRPGMAIRITKETR
jgi:hypothetical protein